MVTLPRRVRAPKPVAAPGVPPPGDAVPTPVPGTDVSGPVPTPLLTPEQSQAAAALLDSHKQTFVPVTLEPKDEAKFQKEVKASGWYQAFVRDFGSAPPLDDPTYDYRGAWQAGLVPQAGGTWPMRDKDGKWFVAPGLQGAWKAAYAAVTGRDADADQVERRTFLGAAGRPEAPPDPVQQQGAVDQAAAAAPPPEEQGGPTAPGIVPLSKMILPPGMAGGAPVPGGTPGGPPQ